MPSGPSPYNRASWRRLPPPVGPCHNYGACRNPATEWDRFDPNSPEGRVCATTGGELNNVPVPPRPTLPIPDAVGVPTAAATSTQEAFGRILTRLGDIAGVAERIVTTSPDVSVSTVGLAGLMPTTGLSTGAPGPFVSRHPAVRRKRYR